MNRVILEKMQADMRTRMQPKPKQVRGPRPDEIVIPDNPVRITSRNKPTMPWPPTAEYIKAAEDAYARHMAQRYRETRTDGFVYLVGISQLQWYKIGITNKESTDERFRGIQNNVPFTLDVKHSWPCVESRTIEARLHKQFARHRGYGEWFNLTPAALKTALRLAETWTSELRRDILDVDSQATQSVGTTVGELSESA
jgi:hypothetical protein